MIRSYRFKVIGALGFLLVWPATAVLAAEDIQLSEVVSGIYVYQGVHEQMSPANLGAIGNSGFIIGERAVAVIDPGGSPEFGRLLNAAVRKVTDLPIEYLVLTHFHPDHVAGSSAFPDVVQVIAHENYAQAMTQRAQFFVERFAELLPGSVQEIFRLPTTKVLAGQSIDIDLGGRVLSIEAHPLAHTDNDITVHDRRSNTLWASDLIFSERTPSLDGSLKGWLEVLNSLDSRNYDLTVPGHGEPDFWPGLLEPQKEYLQLLLEDVRKMLDKGTPLSEVLAIHDASHSSKSGWALYAAQHGSNLAKAYSELEWE
ncbi:MAG: quinoprotein relay system zinc metallohydrolase 2 [Granulosicoccus sp.]